MCTKPLKKPFTGLYQGEQNNYLLAKKMQTEKDWVIMTGPEKEDVVGYVVGVLPTKRIQQL